MVVGLLVLSVITVGIAVMAQRTAAKARGDLDRTTRFDLLTGLPDRHQLEQAIDRLLGPDQKGPDRSATVILIELSRFEIVNDTYGREVGDGLLVAVADQLKGAVGPDEQLFRPGGPQFVVLTTALTDTRMAERRAAELTEVLAVPFRIGTDLVQVATRVGIAMVDDRHRQARDVLYDAGVAVQQSERDDTGRATVFDLSMRPSMSPSNTERRLREALERNEFWLLYLPVVTLDDNEIVGVEALLRWADPERGLVAPDQFLPALESSGLIVPVGEWVLEQACRQNKLWHDAFPHRELLTTVNVSPRQLARPDFMERVLAIVADTGSSPSRLCLEMTEGSVMRDIDIAWGMLRDAKEADIKLALDDFGTGYSSLSYLRRFNLDVLKIDRSFVAGIADNREDAAITQQLVAMAHALDIAPVAEGVDSLAQAQTLHGMGCDFAQGYWFSPPQPVTAIDAFLASGVVRPASESAGIDWSGGTPPGS
ncbi:MAG: putative bifunctional diguanylate cyclase/phosphodiesterase [Acidimicrobiales bacterium]